MGGCTLGQVLHSSATTTEAIRRAIQRSQESLRTLAKRHGINPKTVAKWRKRSSVADLPTGPKVQSQGAVPRHSNCFRIEAARAERRVFALKERPAAPEHKGGSGARARCHRLASAFRAGHPMTTRLRIRPGLSHRPAEPAPIEWCRVLIVARSACSRGKPVPPFTCLSSPVSYDTLGVVAPSRS